jgi:hypothetical protein
MWVDLRQEVQDEFQQLCCREAEVLAVLVQRASRERALDNARAAERRKDPKHKAYQKQYQAGYVRPSRRKLKAEVQ